MGPIQVGSFPGLRVRICGEQQDFLADRETRCGGFLLVSLRRLRPHQPYGATPDTYSRRRPGGSGA